MLSASAGACRLRFSDSISSSSGTGPSAARLARRRSAPSSGTRSNRCRPASSVTIRAARSASTTMARARSGSRRQTSRSAASTSSMSWSLLLSVTPGTAGAFALPSGESKSAPAVQSSGTLPSVSAQASQAPVRGCASSRADRTSVGARNVGPPSRIQRARSCQSRSRSSRAAPSSALTSTERTSRAVTSSPRLHCPTVIRNVSTESNTACTRLSSTSASQARPAAPATRSSARRSRMRRR